MRMVWKKFCEQHVGQFSDKLELKAEFLVSTVNVFEAGIGQ
jgi:hypothetical protein